MNIESIIMDILIEILEENNLSRNTILEECSEWDSLAQLSFLGDLEDIGIQGISDDEFAAAKTVGDLIDKAMSKL